MKQEIAELINDLNPNLRLMEVYSGRGMYGKTTYALSGDYPFFLQAIAELYQDLVTQAVLSYDEEQEDFIMERAEMLSDVLMEHKTDNLGTGVVIY